MRSSDGTPTNALYTFIRMIEPIIVNFDYVLIAGDSRTPTFRHEKYQAYKATRSKTPKELIEQFPLITEYLEKRGIKFYFKNGYEADDVIANVARMCANQGMKVEIYSSDRDLLQLVNENVIVTLIKRNLNNTITYTHKNFESLLGLKVNQFVDFKTLVGDQSDNIPGAPGIGEKTALKLLKEFKTLKNIFDNKMNLQRKIQRTLSDFENQWKLYWMLSKIEDNFEIELSIEDLKRKPCCVNELEEFLNKFDIRSFKLLDAKIKKDEIWKTTMKKVDLKKFTFQEELFLYFVFKNNDYHYHDLWERIKKTSPKHVALANKKEVAIVSISELLNCQPFLFFLNNNVSKLITINAKELLYFLIKETTVKCNIIDLCLIEYLIGKKTKNNIFDLARNYNLNFSKFIKEEKFFKSKINEAEKISLLNFGVDVLCKIYEKVVNRLNQIPLVKKAFTDFESEIPKILAIMENNGIPINLNFLEKEKRFYENALIELKRRFFLTFKNNKIGEFDLDSEKKLKNILFNDLKLPQIRKKSLDIRILEQLKDQHPCIDVLIKYRKLKKILSTYILPFIEKSKESRIYPYFSQSNNLIGKIITTNPKIENIIKKVKEKDFKKALSIENGKNIFLSADYSQIQLRILAHFSKESTLINAFQNDIDVHTLTASKIFKKDFREITYKERGIAKILSYGVIFGKNLFQLMEDLDISQKEIKEYTSLYFETYENIKIFKKEIVRFCEEHNYIETLCGKKKHLPEINSSNKLFREDTIKKIIKAKIEGSQVDILKIAMVKITQEIVNHECKLIGQFDDKLIFEINKETVEKKKKEIENVMKNVFKLIVPFKIKIIFGNNWAELL